MGLLVDGFWQDKWYDTDKHGGKFVRSESTMRSWIKADPDVRFAAEADRYHLYVSLACPWASRVLIYRKLKGLEKVIPMSVVAPVWGAEGWRFAPENGGTNDKLFGSENLHEVYTRADSNFTGRVTVPVLWDKKTKSIVNNESSELIRMFNSEFNEFASSDVDFYPERHREEIDEVNELVYDKVNNGVYKTGFASTQEAYESAFDELFGALDTLEDRLSKQRYLVGDSITEADWRLFVTLVRFDAVYVVHFKCNQRRIVDYPNLWGYTRELYQHPGVAETVDLDHIKRHYYGSHPHLNPQGIVPKGPELDLRSSHGRGS